VGERILFPPCLGVGRTERTTEKTRSRTKPGKREGSRMLALEKKKTTAGSFTKPDKTRRSKGPRVTENLVKKKSESKAGLCERGKGAGLARKTGMEKSRRKEAKGPVLPKS